MHRPRSAIPSGGYEAEGNSNIHPRRTGVRILVARGSPTSTAAGRSSYRIVRPAPPTLAHPHRPLCAGTLRNSPEQSISIRGTTIRNHLGFRLARGAGATHGRTLSSGQTAVVC